jgi:hypothetical protein
VVIATVEGKKYLVSMLGPGSDWVKNVKAAHGEAIIRQGRRRRVRLVAVPPEQRAPILREYVRIAMSGRVQVNELEVLNETYDSGRSQHTGGFGHSVRASTIGN